MTEFFLKIREPQRTNRTVTVCPYTTLFRSSVEEIRKAGVATRGGVPVTVGQLANVKIGGDLRTGAGSMNGKEAVIGTVLMLIGQNSRTVAEDVSAKIAQVSKTLPPGVEVKVVLDRAELVNATVGDRKSTRLNSSH